VKEEMDLTQIRAARNKLASHLVGGKTVKKFVKNIPLFSYVLCLFRKDR
jgi:hypothetical protein